MGRHEKIIEPADRVNAKQHPELLGARSLAQAQSVLHGRGVALRLLRGLAGNCGQNQRQQHEMGQPKPHIDRAPADIEHHQGQRRHDHQLPDAHARQRQRIGEPRAIGERARHHHAHRRGRGGAIADGEDDSIQGQRLPRRLHKAHQPDSSRGYYQARAQQHPQADAIGQTASIEGADCRHTLKQPHREPDVVALPGELLDHRQQRQPDRQTRAAADEQKKKACDQNEQRRERN